MFKFIFKKGLVCLGLIFSLLGCSKNSSPEPETYLEQARVFYQKAEKAYQELIRKSENSSENYFGLGKLYFAQGRFDLAVEALKKSSELKAKKFLALAYYYLGKFTEALEIFNRFNLPDSEYQYYFGLTCEKLNLFDQALKLYRGIKDKNWQEKALLRIEEIEKEKSSLNIQELDPAVAKIIRQAPDASVYPQAGALILLADEEIKVTFENTLESNLHYIVKILNERGKEDFSEAKVEYDSTFEKVELLYARTIKPDGNVVYVGSKHIRDVSEYLNFPLYSNVRLFIISFPEVSIGSILEYKVRIKRTQLINQKDLFLSYPVQSSEPIICARFKISLPKGRAINLKILNQEYNDFNALLSPQIERNKEEDIYSWQFKDIPQVIPEPNMPSDAEINPTFLISTFNSWQEVYTWWWNLSKDKIKTDAAIKEKVKSLIRNKKTDLEKARAIYNFCAKEIRYVAVAYGQAGYEPHSAQDIFKNKYGDCKDQAILLVTMLKEAGLKAYPVLIPTKDYYQLKKDFPSGLFNHCIVVLDLDGKRIFLDPTAETCSFLDLPLADQGRSVLIFKEDGWEIAETPFYPAEKNFVSQRMKVNIKEDGSILAEKINFTFGLYDQMQRWWLLYTQPELIKDKLKSVIQDISVGATLLNYEAKNVSNLDKNVVLSYNFSGPEYFIPAGSLRILPALGSIDTSLIAKETRRYPLDLGFLDKRELEIEIILPKNLKVKYLPKNLEFDNPFFFFKQEYLLQKSSLYFRQLIYNKKEKINPKEYLEFKDLIEKLGRVLKERVVLEEN